MVETDIQRTYRNPGDFEAVKLLGTLLLEGICAEDYQKAMYDLGFHLGEILQPSLDRHKTYCLAITVEDADFLAAGLSDFLSQKEYKVYLACFWNDRKKIAGRDLAPILNSYYDKGYEQADEIIVLKAIMAGACVVKTNISALIEKVKPSAIHVVAPVMHIHSRKNLELEFPESISRLFDYTYLAIDARLDEASHTVIPGVGGNVYEKLGFKNSKDKNAYIPEVLKQRIFA
ncbi:MAG: hypothetical protein H6999_06550 [Hahellaceae bacterium]|nr:hypothetical protein [Hahellaceae bacterium]MCP5169401.1 hypothetical protein [Hahellaceae bacterium]